MGMQALGITIFDADDRQHLLTVPRRSGGGVND